MSALSGARLDVMLVISDLGSGGAQRVLCALCDHWLAAGRKVAVATLSAPEHDFFHLPPKVVRVSIGLNAESRSLAGALIGNARRIWRLRKLLRQLRPSVAVGFVGPTAALLVAAAAGTGIRTVAAERNDPARQTFGPIWDRVRRWAYRRADCVTANSRGAFESLRSLVPAHRLLFTPNPMPRAAAGPRASLERLTILSVGRLHRQKGLDVLLDAFARLNAGDWQIVLLGEGVERERLARQAQELGVADRVRFMGPVADPAPYYRAAQIFVLPSRHEGTPNALMEAMSFGLPAIVSDGSRGPLDLVSDGVTGLVIPVEDATALSAALRRLMDDQGLRARLSAGARAQMAALSARDDAFARWDAAVGFSMQAAAP